MARTRIEVSLHIVFSTKHRANIIHHEIEAELHRSIAGVIANLDSRCIAVNCAENHVHTLVSLETAGGGLEELQLAGRIRGGGSVRRSGLPAVRRSIAAQKEHRRHVSFDEELVSLLVEHGVAYDARSLWD